MPAIHLHAKAGDFLAHVGEEGFDDRNQQRRTFAGGLAGCSVRMAVFQIQLARGVDREHAAAFDQGFLRQQHAPHIRMDDDRVSRLLRFRRPAQGARLQALTGIAQRTLKGCLSNPQPLQTDLKARVVHHGEHAGQPLIGFADQPAAGTVEVHHAGGTALDAHLVFDGAAAQFVACAEGTIGIGDEFRHQQQADALHPRWRIGQTCQHQMHDVLGQVLLAAADKYLAARDPVTAIGLRFGFGAQQGQIGAGLRFGQTHGARPMAADHLAQIGLLECRAAVLVQGQHGAFGEPGIDPE